MSFNATKRFFAGNSVWEWIGKIGLFVGLLVGLFQIYKDWSSPKASMTGTLSLIEVVVPPEIVKPDEHLPRYCARVKLINDGNTTLNDVSIKIPFTQRVNVRFDEGPWSVGGDPTALEIGKVQTGSVIEVAAWADSVSARDLDSIKVVYDGGSASLAKSGHELGGSFLVLSVLGVSLAFLFVIMEKGLSILTEFRKRYFKRPPEPPEGHCERFTETNKQIAEGLMRIAWMQIRQEYEQSIKFRWLTKGRFGQVIAEGVVLEFPPDVEAEMKSLVGEAARKHVAQNFAERIGHEIAVHFALRKS